MSFDEIRRRMEPRRWDLEDIFWMEFERIMDPAMV